MEFGNPFVVLAVLTFVAVVLLVEGFFILWQSRHGTQARKLRSRLQELSVTSDPDTARLLKQQFADASAPLERLARRLPRAALVQRLLTQSGLQWSAGKLLLLSIACAAAVSLLAAWLRIPAALSLALTAVGAVLPLARVALVRQRRLRKLEVQLPEALDLMGRGLRAGHAFSATLKMAGEELPDPIAAEFRAIHEEVNFGVALPQALGNFAERVPSTDFRYFVVAVLIQRESGGNLTEILGNLSRLVRERLKLQSRVRVLSSEGRLSAWILVLLPFALGALFSLFNPGFMRPMWTDPIGITLMKIMLSMMAVGILMLRVIVRIRV
jgi:tight adherence protein B